MRELTHNLRDDGDIGPKSLEIQFGRQDTVIVYISFRQDTVIVYISFRQNAAQN